MKCPQCAFDGEKSTLRIDGSSCTLMGYSSFYDEDGIYHSHDPNRITSGYLCSRGHRIVETGFRICPNCEYGGDKSVTVV